MQAQDLAAVYESNFKYDRKKTYLEQMIECATQNAQRLFGIPGADFKGLPSWRLVVECCVPVPENIAFDSVQAPTAVAAARRAWHCDKRLVHVAVLRVGSQGPIEYVDLTDWDVWRRYMDEHKNSTFVREDRFMRGLGQM